MLIGLFVHMNRSLLACNRSFLTWEADEHVCACMHACVRMRACVCVCRCVRVCTRARVRVRVRVHARRPFISMFMRTCVRGHTSIWKFMHACVRAYVCVCVRMRAYACVCVSMRAYACVRGHISKFMHACVRVCICVGMRACACVCVCACVYASTQALGCGHGDRVYDSSEARSVGSGARSGVPRRP